MQAQVQLPDGAGTKPAWLAVLATVPGKVVVQLLDVEGPKRADGALAEVGTHVVLKQLAVATDGSQPDRLVALQMGEPVVQEVVQGRMCRPKNHRVALAPERLVERRSRGGLGGIAAQVAKASPPWASGAARWTRGYQRTHRGEHRRSAFLWPFMHLRSIVPLGMARPFRRGAWIGGDRRRRVTQQFDAVRPRVKESGKGNHLPSFARPMCGSPT